MEIVSQGPFRTAGLRWFLSSGAPALTVICKTTFLLQEGESPLAPEQDPPNEDDTYWDDDPRKSLSLATELVPYKARADVIVVGHTFAPEQKPSRSWVARLIVGSIHKAIEVYSERAFGQDGELREGAPITKNRLRYERAAGGPDSYNPVGMRFDVQNSLGMTAIPTLQPAGVLIARSGDTFGPVGFGPVAPGWPGRRNKLRGQAASFGGRGWNALPIPDGVEAAYFNSAPPDQQVDALRADERIVLECLHPHQSRLTTRLRGTEPVASVERSGRAPQSLPLVCDTLWIDTDRCVCHLVWRGTLPLNHAAESGRVTVSSAKEARLPLPSSTAPRESPSAADTTMAPMVSASKLTLPFALQPKDDDRSSAIRPSGRNPALPFGASGDATPAAPAQHFVLPESAPGDSTVFLFDVAPSLAAPLPAPPAPPAPAVPSSPIEPPRVVPPPLGVMGPAVAKSAWSSTDAEPVGRRESVGERMAQELAMAESKAQLDKKSSGEPERLGPLAKAHVPASAPSFSQAASSPDLSRADPSGRAAARMTDAREALLLVWFDATSMRRIRRHKPFRSLLDEAEQDPADVDLDDTPLGDPAAEVEDRRDILEVFTRGLPTDAQGVLDSLDRCISDRGTIVPPLALCAGELIMPFDPVETLQATITTVTPLSAGDDNLKASLQIGTEFLALPKLHSAPSVAEGMVKRIHEAFGRAKRVVSSDYLEAQTERTLLEQRCYQRRKIFGAKHLRGLLSMPGAKDPIPTYLPEALADQIPMYARFRVRLVAELRMSEDQYESHPAALRVLALARVVSRPGRG